MPRFLPFPEWMSSLAMLVRPAVTRLLVLCSAAACAAAGLTTVQAVAPAAAATPLSIHVSGDQLVNGAGKAIQLTGFSHSGTEYECIAGAGIFDGDVSAAGVQAMTTWHAKMVRIPLNEDCWLGINGAPAAYSGAVYQYWVGRYVQEINAAGMYVDLELHWNAPGGLSSTGQQVMADYPNAVNFWTSVASYFKSYPAVTFEPYNEPHDISWSCWLNGCTTPLGYPVAGMQQLVNAIRSTGAQNVILVDGLAWSNDLSGWLTYRVRDPLHQLAASAHVYPFNACNTSACWSTYYAPVAKVAPLVTTEVGENSGECDGNFAAQYMNWADHYNISYLAWTYNAWDCSTLITSYTGTPTQGFGTTVQQHFLTRS